jgi:hypothetical protein
VLRATHYDYDYAKFTCQSEEIRVKYMPNFNLSIKSQKRGKTSQKKIRKNSPLRHRKEAEDRADAVAAVPRVGDH